MKTETGDKILAYIKQKERATARELWLFLQISQTALFRQLKKLQDKGKITKIGRVPRVFYILAAAETPPPTSVIMPADETQKIITENFLTITPTGEYIEGVDGFIRWCAHRDISDIAKAASDYAAIWKKYDAMKSGGLLNGMEKLKNTFPRTYLDKIFYLDFYAVEQFGKTKLGSLVAYAKQSQDIALIQKIADLSKQKILNLITAEKIDAVGYIPPTVPRQIQLLQMLSLLIDIQKPRIKIIKVNKGLAVPQKSLNKLEERVENARETIIVDEKIRYNNILLIDDAVGSGATLNETAKKIREQNLCAGKITGLALVGSIKGFDIISGI